MDNLIKIVVENVGGFLYTYSMIGKRNKARAKAESKALFNTMLKFKHTVTTPEPKRGTRATNNRKAINEQL